MPRWLREPALHFLLIGAGLFVLYGWMHGRASFSRDTIVITEGRLDQLAAGFAGLNRRPPTREEMDGMVRDAVREEIFYREAMALRLDEDDVIVRRHLAQKLQFVSEDTHPLAEPTEAQLRDFLARHSQQLQAERGYSFTQVFLNPQRHGARLHADSQRLLESLRRAPDDATLIKDGDPFLLDSQFERLPAGEVARLFGADFERALQTLATGQWQGPVLSSFGTHLVLLRGRDEPGPPQLTDVRDEVRRQWMNEQRELAAARFYADLRRRYNVKVQLPSTSAAPSELVAAGR
jgi:PPIC-type PPIASE domain